MNSVDFAPQFAPRIAPATVLVVDDQTSSRLVISELLSVEGHQVLEADGSRQVFNCIEEHQPDLVLLDVIMPEVDGFEICRQLKQSEQTRWIPVILMTASSDRSARLSGIEAGADDFLLKPFGQTELSARVRSLINQKRFNQHTDHAEQVLFSMAKAVENRDPSTGDHCDRIVQLSQSFGHYLGLSTEEIRNLVWGSYLHDIGKVGIPDAILLKADRLTASEWVKMRHHVLIGEEICKPMRALHGVTPIIRHHHERWDGSGYPDGLVGEQIPKLAQIFQLLDIFDALSNARSYKPALSLEKTLHIMKAETRKGWRNPDLFAQFVKFMQLEDCACS
ncbi:MAG: HD domain-containing phosphohydrolase [Cyanobacteria bacterium P01_D01_bin.44]